MSSPGLDVWSQKSGWAESTTLTPGTGKSVAKQSRSQPGPDSQFTGLEREVGARRQAG